MPGSKDEAFERLTGALGVAEIAKGASVLCDVDGVPAFSGEAADSLFACGGAEQGQISLLAKTPAGKTAIVSSGTRV